MSHVSSPQGDSAKNLINAYPKGYGYFAERPSTKVWSMSSSLPQPARTTATPQPRQGSAWTTFGGLVLLALIVIACVWGVRHGINRDDTTVSPTNSQSSTTNHTKQPDKVTTVQLNINQVICPNPDSPYLQDVQRPASCYAKLT